VAAVAAAETSVAGGTGRAKEIATEKEALKRMIEARETQLKAAKRPKTEGA